MVTFYLQPYPNPKCGRLGCPEQAQVNEFFCLYHRLEWDKGHVTPTIYYDAYYYHMDRKEQGDYIRYGYKTEEVCPLMPYDAGFNARWNPHTGRYEFLNTTAAAGSDNPNSSPYQFGPQTWGPTGTWNYQWQYPYPLTVDPVLVAKPIEDDDLDEGALIQVDNARVLGTALRRFIETSGVDDPYVLAQVLAYINHQV